jgi:hypothetical protein
MHSEKIEDELTENVVLGLPTEGFGDDVAVGVTCRADRRLRAI